MTTVLFVALARHLKPLPQACICRGICGGSCDCDGGTRAFPGYAAAI